MRPLSSTRESPLLRDHYPLLEKAHIDNRNSLTSYSEELVMDSVAITLKILLTKSNQFKVTSPMPTGEAQNWNQNNTHYWIDLIFPHMISKSVREALDEPLNYARIDLADIIPPDVDRTIYLDSHLIVVDDIRKLWGVVLSDKVVAATEYCHANFTTYFTPAFWSDPVLARTY